MYEYCNDGKFQTERGQRGENQVNGGHARRVNRGLAVVVWSRNQSNREIRTT